jgi:hypothetical protein
MYMCIVKRQFDSNCVFILLIICSGWLDWLILLALLCKVWFDTSRSEYSRTTRESNNTVFIVYTKKGEGSCLVTCLVSWSLTLYEDKGVQRKILKGRGTRPISVVKSIVDLSPGPKLLYFFYYLLKYSSKVRDS